MLEKQSDITTVCPWCDVVYFKDEVHDDFYFATRPIRASPSSTLTPQQENAYKISVLFLQAIILLKHWIIL